MIIPPEALLAQIDTAMSNDVRMPIQQRIKEAGIIRDRFMSSESKEQQDVFNILFHHLIARKLASWNTDHRLDRLILDQYIMMMKNCVSTRNFNYMENADQEITDFFVEMPHITYNEVETKVADIAILYMKANLLQCCYNWTETYLYYMSSVMDTHVQYDRSKAILYMDMFLRLRRDNGCTGSEALFSRIVKFAQYLLPREELTQYGI